MRWVLPEKHPTSSSDHNFATAAGFTTDGGRDSFSRQHGGRSGSQVYGYSLRGRWVFDEERDGRFYDTLLVETRGWGLEGSAARIEMTGIPLHEGQFRNDHSGKTHLSRPKYEPETLLHDEITTFDHALKHARGRSPKTTAATQTKQPIFGGKEKTVVRRKQMFTVGNRQLRIFISERRRYCSLPAKKGGQGRRARPCGTSIASAE